MKYIASVIKSKLPFRDKSWESKIGGKRVVYTSKCLASGLPFADSRKRWLDAFSI